MLVPTPALLGPPSPGPHEPVPQPSLSGAVRASSGQPFWLLVWRLRGLLRRGRPARASGAGDPASLFWGVRHEAAGRWARVCLCLLRWGARGVGRGEHLHTFFSPPPGLPSFDLSGPFPRLGGHLPPDRHACFLDCYQARWLAADLGSLQLPPSTPKYFPTWDAACRLSWMPWSSSLVTHQRLQHRLVPLTGPVPQISPRSPIMTRRKPSQTICCI